MDDSLADASMHRRELEAFRLLQAVTRLVHDSLDLDETLNAVVSGAAQAAGFELAVVNVLEPDGTYCIRAVRADEPVRATLLGARSTAEQWRVLIAEAEDWGPLRFLDHDVEVSVDDSSFRWIPDTEIPSDPEGWHPCDALFAPLFNRSGTLVGSLSVDLPYSGRRPDSHQREMLALFAEQAGIAIDNAIKHAALSESRDRLRALATLDPLTGLSNRSLLADEAVELARVAGRQIAVLALDLDGFKLVNDTAGHAVGDMVLTVLAERLRGRVRAEDLLVRTGGDEFVIVLVGSDLIGRTHSLVGELERAVRAPIAGPGGRPTASASASVWPSRRRPRISPRSWLPRTPTCIASSA